MKIYPIIPIYLILCFIIPLIIFIILKSNKKVLDLTLILLLFIINLRIMIPTNNSKIISNDLDVLFVIDNTISMNAEDYNGTKTRLSGIKKDCKYIINRLNGARFSIITFNNNARIIIPYTKDINITKESIDIIEPINELYAKGSTLNTPLENILISLKSSEKKDNRIRILFFISDGEVTNDSELESYKEIKDHITNGAVLGYGTSSGGYMKSTVENLYNDDYIVDYSGDNHGKALSKIDENNLKHIANDMNINYIKMDKQSNINSKIKEIENIITTNKESNDKSSYDDIYFIFIIPLLIILILEYKDIRRKSWKSY